MRICKQDLAIRLRAVQEAEQSRFIGRQVACAAGADVKTEPVRSGSRFTRLLAHVPIVSQFVVPESGKGGIIPSSPRRLRSLWKSKNFMKPFR